MKPAFHRRGVISTLCFPVEFLLGERPNFVALFSKCLKDEDNSVSLLVQLAPSVNPFFTQLWVFIVELNLPYCPAGQSPAPAQRIGVQFV